MARRRYARKRRNLGRRTLARGLRRVHRRLGSSSGHDLDVALYRAERMLGRAKKTGRWMATSRGIRRAVKNPLTRAEAARLLSVARKHRHIASGYKRHAPKSKQHIAWLHDGMYRGMRNAVHMTVNRKRNPILQAVLPAVMTGAASAVGMRIMDRVLPPARASNPRRRMTAVQRARLVSLVTECGFPSLGRRTVRGSGTRQADLVRFASQRLRARRVRNPFRVYAQKITKGQRGAPTIVGTFSSRAKARASQRAFALKNRSSATYFIQVKKNPRHGTERAPRHLRNRPAQRVYGAKIIDGQRGICLRDEDCRIALEASRRFHGKEPVHLTRVFQADGRKETTVKYGFVMGEAPEAAYTAWKHARSNKRGKNGKRIVWVHKFGEGGGRRPLLAHYPRTGETGFLGGSFRVTDWMHR